MSDMKTTAKRHTFAQLDPQQVLTFFAPANGAQNDL